MSRDHVALLAVQDRLDPQSQKSGIYEVIAIGTKPGAPAEWRCAILPLDEFRKRFQSDGKIFADEEIGSEFPNIVVAAFYAFDQEPLARLDTIAFVEEDGKLSSGVFDDTGWRVSRLKVTPDKTRKGVITSFNLEAHVALALNGHHKVSESAGDHFDTRAIFKLSADQTATPRTLWEKTGTGQPKDEHSAWFDDALIEITVRPWNGKYSECRIVNALKEGGGRLSNFADDEPPGVKLKVQNIPLFDDLKFSQPNTEIERRWAFRAGDFRADGKTPKRLIFRFEFEVRNKSGYDDVFEALLDGLLEPNERKAVLDAVTTLYFSQEQRLGDIAAALTPAGTVHWIVAMRFDPFTEPGFVALAQTLLAGLSVAQMEVGRSQRRIADGSALSVLPTLTEIKGVSGKAMPWHIFGQLRDTGSWRRIIRKTPGTARDNARSTSWKVIEPRLSFDYWLPFKDSEKRRLTAKAELKRLLSTEGTSIAGLTVEIRAPERAAFDADTPPKCMDHPSLQPALSEVNAFEDVDGGIRFGLHITAMPKLPEVLVGAFRLLLGAPSATSEPGQQMCLIRCYGKDGDRLRQGIELALALPLRGVLPGGQDAPIASGRAARRDAARQLLADTITPDPAEPLFFPLFDPSDPKPAMDGNSYELMVRETAARGRDHEIGLMLRHVGVKTTAPAEALVVVIDPEPYRVMGVKYVEPRAAANDETNEVAVWNAGGEGGLSWRVRDDSQIVQLLLPAQTIGEAMEKNRVDDAERPPDIAPGRAAAARFGSPAVVEIDPTYAETDFREPGWNLRRILGYPGQRSPGARLRGLRAELVYGLTTRLVPQSDVWLSEIGAALGLPPSKFPGTAGQDQPALQRHLRVSNAAIDAEKRRLAVEKLWSGRPDLPLKIERGLSFGLRHREKDNTLAGPATPFRWPVPGDIPSDLALSKAQRELIEQTFSVARDDRQSFPGGVPWAFESANILAEVYRQPLGESGRVQGVHLSALGAWAGQRALFAEDKTVIDTDITMGRLQRYKLERIGRIGALWHRAKHVIVYERTVVPSRQFYNLYPIGLQQDEHAGRPVPRKVEEYVELLQPVRRYPENGTSVSAAGFLTGVEFKSIRIPVDSRWGGDVRREGWAVPLWNAAFAAPAIQPDNPDDPSLVYPKPQIRCLFAGVDGGEVAVEIDEPQKLVFYTSTLQGDRGGDTDAWRAVREIDFVDLPVPVAGRLSPRSDQLSDALLPPEPRHVPGYERLTLKLKSTEETVALMHGRAAEGPGAVLGNVTVARAIAATGGDTALRSGLAGLAGSAANVRAEIDAAIGRSLGVLEKLDPKLNHYDRKSVVKSAIMSVVDAQKATLIDDLKKRGADLALPDVGPLVKGLNGDGGNTALRGKLVTSASSEIGRLAYAARGLVDEAMAGVHRPLQGASGFATSALALLDALRIPGPGDEYYELPDEDRDVLIETLRDVHERLWDVADDLKADIDELARNVSFDIARIAALAGGEVAATGSGIKTELKALQTVVIALRQAITAAGGKITIEVQTAAAAVAGAAAKLGEQLSVVRRKIDGGGNAPALRAFISLCGLIESAATMTATVLQNLPVGSQLPAPVTGALDRVDKYLGRIIDALEQLLTGLTTGGVSAISQLAERADKLVGKIRDELKVKVDELTARLVSEEVTEPIIAAIAALSQDVEDEDFSAWAREAIDAVKALLAALAVVAGKLDTAIKEVAEAARLSIDGSERDLVLAAEAGIAQLFAAANSFETMLRELLATDFKGALLAAYGLDQPEAIAAKLRAAVADAIDTALADAKQDVDRLVEDIKAEVYAVAADTVRDIETRGRQLLGSLQSSVTEALGTDPAALADEAKRLAQEGSDVLRLIRAVGDPPKTDRLGLNRPEVAYVLNEVDKVIDITPAVALVNRVSDTLAAIDQAGKALGDLIPGMGIRLPTGRLAENLMPDALKNLSVPNLIPHIGGLDLRGLLARAGFPDLDDLEAVKVTQGFDKAERRLWMNAVIDVPFTEPVDILTFGPVTLAVDDARFFAESRLTAGLGGSTQKINGRIAGDWRVVCSGQDIITFRRTGLFFDESGKLDFKIAPERVELAEPLEFLTNFLAASGKGKGLVVEPLLRGGVPAGVIATLDIALPDLTLGAFAITSLSLHVMFGVAAIPEFEVIGEVSVAQRTAPFTLSVWILNGGGYLTQRMSFRPTARPKPVLTYTLDVGIVAGVGLGFNFGVVSGGVWLQVGCSIAITWTTERGGNSTTVTVFILARGNVDIAGLITASIMLLLEVSYDGARMIGRGTLRLSFKISMFYTLRVNQKVEYTFIGKKSDKQDYAEAYA